MIQQKATKYQISETEHSHFYMNNLTAGQDLEIISNLLKNPPQWLTSVIFTLKSLSD